jgi:putative SOS response-associated peptidase YedK
VIGPGLTNEGLAYAIPAVETSALCNLYNITTTREAMRQIAGALRDKADYYQPSLDVYPNTKAPVVRVGADGERQIDMLTWGMPTPPDRVKGKADCGTTNIRNPTFAH